jgi:hypothetical protein
MPLRRPAEAVDGGFAELASMWLDGLSRAHDPGCGCGGLFAPALQADLIEADLTDYLLARYRQQGSTGLMRLIEARKVDAAHRPFEAWITGLDKAELAVDERARIEADLRVFVESLSGQGGRNIGICT